MGRVPRKNMKFPCGALRRILRILKGIMPLSGVLRGSAPKRNPRTKR